MPTDKPSKPPAHDDGNKRLQEQVERFRESVRDRPREVSPRDPAPPAPPRPPIKRSEK